MAVVDVAELEYSALRSEERDRMNARLQIWTIYLSLVGVFGFASIQSGYASYVIAICPLTLACLARYVGHYAQRMAAT